MYKTKRTYSQDEIDLFFNFVKEKCGDFNEGDVFCDIGANIGTTSVYVSKNKESHLSVLAFEPDGTNYRLLSANALINDCKDFVAVNKGLSDKNEEFTFAINQKNRGASRIISKNDIEKYKSNEKYTISHVNTIIFDEYITQHKEIAGKIKLLWIDVEGHEPHAISGMKNFLSVHKVPLFMEFTAQLYSDSDFELLFDVLSTVYNRFMYTSTTHSDAKIEMKEYKIDNLRELYNSKVEQCNLIFW